MLVRFHSTLLSIIFIYLNALIRYTLSRLSIYKENITK